MTDYYPLLARAVAGLEKNTGEARRALYERARTALLAQLRGADPPIAETEITRERLALEEAVRKIEADAARQMRAPPTPPTRPENKTAGARPELPRRDQPPPRQPVSSPPQPELHNEAPARPPETRRPPPAPAPPRGQPPVERPESTGDGIKGIRDVVAEAQNLGGATAQAARSAREAYAAVPSNVPDLDRMEPRQEPAGFRTEARQPTRNRQPEPQWVPPEPEYGEVDPAEGENGRRRVPGPMPRRSGYGDGEERANPARRGLIAAILTVLIIAGLGGAAYWQRERVSAWFGAVKGLAPQAQRDQAQTRQKDAGRVGQEGQPGQPGTQPSAGPGVRPGAPPPAVAQRVVLYEEDPSNPEGNRYSGSALWRTETISPGPGLSPELAIRADVEVPERRLAMTMSIRRNADQALPASHTVEILFNLPADFAFGGVANVPGLLMKDGEQARGAPMSGLAVKVTNNFFLIGLSAVEADVQRNLQLLQERSWFDIPVVYNNGRRAILAIEKGNPGERAFNDAFAAWKR